jgi:TonB family protein
MTSRTVHLIRQNRDRLERTLGTYRDGVVYAIYAFENPKRKQSLEELITEFGRPDSNFKRELDVGGVRGKEYAFHRDEVTGVTQFYITEAHIYVFEAVGSSLGSPDVGINKFLESIKFGKNVAGQMVVDGPGTQPDLAPTPAVGESDGRVFNGRDVARKAVVITKPEPAYTETARRNQVSGTVVIRCVFSSSGNVANIHVFSGLPDGLNEKSIAAARQIRFIPAIKDGRFVSTYMQLEYNFNLY